jgi:hypothetical protein
MRKLRVMIITIAVCAAIFLLFRFPAVFSGDAISFLDNAQFGEHIVVHSISMEIVTGIVSLSGAIILCTMIRRRLSDRRKGPQKLIRGGKASEQQ